ncbi:bifunctional 4-hydroxy-2-oxoglutarate aldolase/2-dehydro-3-deoxy-phosphogluconate aldolase [Sphingobacterium pedocola]|uniref:Bifunctional 4-hydroxy-2-oxoglutarate aldolase/2-dehydro-3-deoxy-phosphogluconate aldolase n=1 Tax=Sphingobacterium pedocola TaxID=2082722 RepID=A0ABR9T4D8_9SPHI|nr:bifunctional 4-hydroxy-2-oxoglutarate aldolase/2-dehydro-3-deoxy-phosphogluconate aldolase [Sphingobacterium pedocola]MBE8720206.1 bifunctional 4-hydroxy-2-oxoglutarate aldolase/2-dehydro-3-deoxy-phosphogluconate aldolase [Sphingobacterium pedocola]
MNNILETINKYPVIPVYYHDDSAKCIEIVKAAYEGGIRVFEFVNRGEKALENFKILLEYKNLHLPGLVLGIGTIKDVEQAKSFLAVGAEFIVSPIIEPSIARETLDKGILWIPGCMTPSEIAVAEKLGAPLVKLFPGDTLGPNFLKAIKPLFPKVKFMPTGGVDVEEKNIQEWFDAGVYSVGLGSKLFQEPEGATDYSWLAERSKQLFSWINK